MSKLEVQSKRRIWFWISILINLGFLVVFKYYNFFATSFAALLSQAGVTISPHTLSIILPVGISFYTFHGLSYVIDIYKNRIEPERNIITYSLFVSFFPLLVAGPIERASHLLPQIKKQRMLKYSQAVDGLKQILWGLFKKVVIADTCAKYANLIFNNYSDYNGFVLFAGALFFSIQIYGDFSGYSDIALGTARLFGIELIQNFSFPYFSRDIAEFWRRWHISLSTWFRDYLYIPLGGSKGSTWLKIRNTFIIFLVSGFWHGANWTFIFWGLLNAIYILPFIFFKTNRNNIEIVAKGKMLPSLKDFFSILFTFVLTVFAWIFFRSNSVDQAFFIVKNIIIGVTHKQSYIDILNIMVWHFSTVVNVFSLIFLLIIIEWFGRENKYGFESFGTKLPRFIRWGIYQSMILIIFYCLDNNEDFIYFQF